MPDIADVRLAAERMTDAGVEGMRRLPAQQRTRGEQRADQAYFRKEGDFDFHGRVVRGSGNARLIQLLCNDLYHLVRLYRY